jgi:hypothetical protein
MRKSFAQYRDQCQLSSECVHFTIGPGVVAQFPLGQKNQYPQRTRSITKVARFRDFLRVDFVSFVVDLAN